MVLDFRGNWVSGKSVVLFARAMGASQRPLASSKKKPGFMLSGTGFKNEGLGRSHDSENNFTVSDCELGFRIWG